MMHELDLAKAVYKNWKSAFIDFSDSTIESKGVVYTVNPTIPFELFNTVLETKLQDENINNVVDIIEKVRETYEQKNIRFEWPITPFTEPKNFEDILKENNFIEQSSTPHMAVLHSELDIISLSKELQDSNLEIVRVAAHNLAEYFIPFFKGFGIEKNEVLRVGFTKLLNKFIAKTPKDTETGIYTGYVNGEPVSTSLGYVSDGVMGIYNIATIPEHRGKGYGRWMTLDLILRGADFGLKASILQSSKMGKPVYEKLGFETVFTQRNFVLQDKT
jgi:ribosomal protein S18 acetylase RimI-like enzyme